MTQRCSEYLPLEAWDAMQNLSKTDLSEIAWDLALSIIGADSPSHEILRAIVERHEIMVGNGFQRRNQRLCDKLAVLPREETDT